MERNSISLNWIKDYNKPGVYLLLDKANNCFYINYTTSLSYLFNVMLDIVSRAPANSDFEFIELESGSDLETLKLHTEYWIDQYLGMGYEEMERRGRRTVQYKVRMLASLFAHYYDVQLVSKRGTKVKTVGRFDSRAEAQEFMTEYYGDDNPYNLPIYATNSLTRELLSMTGEPGFILG